MPAASALRARPSRGDRERVARVLRHAAAEERLSWETFAQRIDIVYAARTRAELDRVLADLPEPTYFRRFLLTTTTSASRMCSDLAAAWRQPKLPQMPLPRRERVVIGRSPGSDFIVTDPTVSGSHAIVSYADGAWKLEDSDSTNGTFVNGWRIAEPILVYPGDEITVGETTFLLVRDRH
jgi:hypothetical protein